MERESSADPRTLFFCSFFLSFFLSFRFVSFHFFPFPTTRVLALSFSVSVCSSLFLPDILRLNVSVLSVRPPVSLFLLCVHRVYLTVISIPFSRFFRLSLSAETLSFAFHCPPSMPSHSHSLSFPLLFSLRLDPLYATSKRACAPLQSLANRGDRTLRFHCLPSSFPFLLPVYLSLEL